MLKALAIVAVLCIATGMAGQPNQAGSAEQKPSSIQKPVLPTAASENTVEHHSETNQASCDPDDKPFSWHKAIKRPEWWLIPAAYFTLIFLIGQTIENRKAAEAALLNAQAVIASERPFITIEVVPSLNGERFQVIAANHGKVPAEIWSFTSDSRIFPTPDGPPLPPNYGMEGRTDVYRRISVVGEPPFSAGDALMVAELREGDATAMAKVDSLDKFLFFWGRIVYISALGKERPDLVPYETRWCFKYIPPTVGGGPRLVRSGPVGYNEHT